jgi:ethanolamine utilization protein EutJ
MAVALSAVRPEPSVFLRAAAPRLRAPAEPRGARPRFGVDLGTASVVLCAVDEHDAPVYWDFIESRTVRDGVVVDFQGAVRCVRELKTRAEAALGVTVGEAVTAHPPGVAAGDARACRYVLEASDIACRELIDEISAAQTLVGVRDGAVVDVGGGSTGVGIVRDGVLVALSDVPGGGHHLDLILAGALKIELEPAERRKRAGGAEVAQILRAGIERIAESIRRLIEGRAVESVHLVGGALLVEGAEAVVAEYLGLTTVAYPHADLITPFGMALR